MKLFLCSMVFLIYFSNDFIYARNHIEIEQIPVVKTSQRFITKDGKRSVVNIDERLNLVNTKKV